MNKNIRGLCSNMCPQEECEWRKRHLLVHELEMNKKNEAVEDTKMVKQFVRSAVGKKLVRPEILRKPDCLYKTVDYLLKEIISKNVGWRLKYDFISDRLRSVRQDAVIQNFEPYQWLPILPSMIRFHCYATYRLEDDDLSFWDINLKCLTDCFTTLMDVYDSLKYSEMYDKKEKQEMLTLYALINIGRMDLNGNCMNNFDDVLYPPAEIISKICKDFVTENHIQILTRMRMLPIIHQCSFFALHVNVIRRIMLHRIFISHSCGKKMTKYAVSKLSRILQYDSEKEFINVCYDSDIQLSEDEEYVIVSKHQAGNIKHPKTLKWELLEKRLAKIDLSSLLLNCTIKDSVKI